MTEESTAGVQPTALEQKRREKIAEQQKQEIVLDGQIPAPVGYQILIALPNTEETFGDSGIVKAGETLRNEQILSMVGVVLDMGADAYADTDRYPRGPWCNRGDYVLFRANTGTRFRVGKQEYRLMNDDSIQAVVEDPSKITRA